LRTAYLPKGLRELGTSAFRRSGIETITIDDGNEFFTVSERIILNKSQTVAIRCFTRVRQITIPASVEIIGEYCFSGCEWISEIAFAHGSQLREIQARAFYNCFSLRRIWIPPFVEVLDSNCFGCCTSLVAVIFDGDSCLSEINEGAFSNCDSLKSFFIPKTVQVIGPSPFDNSALESIIIDSANKSFSFVEGLLMNHSRIHLIQNLSRSECISIPATVKTLGKSCFQNNEVLRTIRIPKIVEVIPEECFCGCSNLSSFSVESGSHLRRIENSAFAYCHSLNNILVPASVELLGHDCFLCCTSLTVITFEPDCCLKEIGEWAFFGCSFLRRFDFPHFVEVIGSYCFDYCISLSEFCVPRGSRLQRIGKWCFHGSQLGLFHLPASIEFIDLEAFPQSCRFEIECGNHASALREWSIRFREDPTSTFDICDLSTSLDSIRDTKVTEFLQPFDEADTRKAGTLDFYALRNLIEEVLGDRDEEMAQMYFKGIDMDGRKTITRGEFKDFINAALNGDKVYMVKLLFRAFDEDRNRALGKCQLKSMSKYFGKELRDAEIDHLLKEMKGGPLNFAQVVKVLTGEPIDPITDPYDGRLKKSSCCLLL
jgi:Ca2+-binding EF-hand superfamily protein